MNTTPNAALSSSLLRGQLPAVEILPGCRPFYSPEQLT